VQFYARRRRNIIDNSDISHNLNDEQKPNKISAHDTTSSRLVIRVIIDEFEELLEMFRPDVDRRVSQPARHIGAISRRHKYGDRATVTAGIVHKLHSHQIVDKSSRGATTSAAC